MAAYTGDNYLQVAHNGVYGNRSGFVSVYTLPVLAAADTFDLVKIPGGARITGGMMVITTAITTSTFHVGVRYADGTSTGGTTGTAVISGTGVTLGTAAQQNAFQFVPFMNDVDTIVYATFANGAAVTAGNIITTEIDYEATGTK